jgi:hypothetical protein
MGLDPFPTIQSAFPTLNDWLSGYAMMCPLHLFAFSDVYKNLKSENCSKSSADQIVLQHTSTRTRNSHFCFTTHVIQRGHNNGNRTIKTASNPLHPLSIYNTMRTRKLRFFTNGSSAREARSGPLAAGSASAAGSKCGGGRWWLRW